MLNAYRDGDERPYRKIVEDATLVETIRAAAELVGHDLLMKLYGRGIAAVNYPTGMNLGGDPTQALVHATTVGNFVITLSSVDLGQGLKTVLAQIGAEALGVPFETVRVDTGDTDTGPHCMGTFASRATHRAGNAIMRAADEAKRVAARGRGRGDGGLARRPRDRRRGQRARDRLARLLDDRAGRRPGGALQARQDDLRARDVHEAQERGRAGDRRDGPRLDRGARVHGGRRRGRHRDRRSCACCGWLSAYEIGCAINPALVQGQIRGGAWMGMSHCLYETTAPYYPAIDHAPGDFSTYLMPGPLGPARDRGGGARDALARTAHTA